MTLIDTCYYTKRVYLEQRMTYFHACARAILAGRAEVGVNPLSGRYADPPARHHRTTQAIARHLPVPATQVRMRGYPPPDGRPTFLTVYYALPNRSALARRLNMSNKSLRSVATGREMASPARRLRIAAALDMTPDQIQWPEWLTMEGEVSA